MADFLIAPLLVFLMLAIWILVQFAARAFARRHPELGPAREEGGGCGSGACGCGAVDTCTKKNLLGS